jgi:ubiquinone biosynthesis protein COQ4
LSVCGASKNSDGLPKYEGHYPLDTPQRMFLGPVSAVSALLQPTRGDMVATLGEVTGTAALRYMLKQMQSDPVGRQILEERPIVSEATVDPRTLIKLPEDTMGHRYAKYMLSHR